MYTNAIRNVLDPAVVDNTTGPTVLVHEADPDAILRNVFIRFSTDNIVAIRVDRPKIGCKKKKYKCPNLKSSIPSTDSHRCAGYVSRVCSLVSPVEGYHTGCDKVVFEEFDNRLNVYIVELKSNNDGNYQDKFNAVVSLVGYLTRIVGYFNGIKKSIFVYPVLFSLVPHKKRKTRPEKTIETDMFNDFYQAYRVPVPKIDTYSNPLSPYRASLFTQYPGLDLTLLSCGT